MVEIGKGMCRGHGWSSKSWPMQLSYRIPQDCADECAKRPGCTAFDLSKKSGKKFVCNLYGHKDVEPAAAMKGTCYTYVGNELAEVLADDDVLDEIEDKTDEVDDGSKTNIESFQRMLHVIVSFKNHLPSSSFLEKDSVGVTDGRASGGQSTRGQS